MDYFSDDILEIPSIAPDLMFADDEELVVPTAIDPLLSVNKCKPVILTVCDKEKILQFVFNDHAYAKPYPVLTCVNYKLKNPLVVMKLSPKDLPERKQKKTTKNKLHVYNEDEIDVETVERPLQPLIKCDVSRARSIMCEVETYLHSLWKDVDKDDEEKISRTSWSKENTRLFDSTLKIINNYQLAKLAYARNSNEPVLRKLALDKATKRLRKTFASVMWNPKLIVWLHGIMIDGLGSSLFLCYLEILQSLKRKVPALFENVFLNDKLAVEKEITAGLPNLAARLKKSWDPSVGLQTKLTMQKFKTMPFLIVIPSGPSIPHQSTKRNRFWNNQLMNIGKTIPISVPAYRTPEGYVIKYYIEHSISTIRANILEFRTRFPDRHVVLIGWGVGSLMAFKVALLDKVDAVICLGFPCKGLDDSNSQDYWKHFTKIECPVLFFIGTHALTNSIEKTEELREKMKTQTNLIVMESGDEMLRLPKTHKRTLGMTQNMIDRLVQDEIYLFLKDVLFKPKPVYKPLKSNQTPKKRKRKIEVNEIEAKKTKKCNVKSELLIHINTTASTVTTASSAISIQSADSITNSPTQSCQSQGLLITGSISTTIPVTQLYNETLVTPTVRVIGDNVISTNTKSDHEANQKKNKERSKVKNKQTNINKNLSSPQNFTANLGTLKSGNLTAQRYSNTEFAISKCDSTHQVSVHRVPSGSFVLSGASGHVRLQGGTNLVYLQQASSGATHLVHTPITANSSTTFTAVLSTTVGGATSSSFTFVPGQRLKPGVQEQNIIVQTQKKTDFMTVQLQSSSGKSVTSLGPPTGILSNPPVVTSVNQMNPTTNPTTIATSTIMTHLSANDLRYLATLIAKHNSEQANSSVQTGSPMTTNTILSNMLNTNTSLLKPLTKVSVASLSSPDVKSNSSSSWPQMTTGTKLLSASTEKKSPVMSSNYLKKVSYSPSLIHKVAAVQLQKDSGGKAKPTAIKPPRIVTNATAVGKSAIPSTVVATKIVGRVSSSVKSGQKVPVTLTIPVSRLGTTISSAVLSKSISVPGLSAYLAQQRFVLSSSKAGSPNRTISLNPAHSKKNNTSAKKVTSIAVSDSVNVTTAARTIFVSNQNRPVGTASLSVPLDLLGASALRKSAADKKLVGILNPQTNKIITPLKPVTTSDASVYPSDEELSPITPRKQDEDNNTERSIISPLKVFSTPRFQIDCSKPNTAVNKLVATIRNDTDVDLAVTPTTTRSISRLNKPVVTEASKYFDVTKLLSSFHHKSKTNENQILRASSVDVKTFSKNSIGIAKNEILDSSLKYESIKNSDQANRLSTAQTSASTLSFEPIKVSTNRSNLSQVLSSMRDAEKIVFDDNGKMCATILSKSVAASSKTTALISKTKLLDSLSVAIPKSMTTQNPIVSSPICAVSSKILSNAKFPSEVVAPSLTSASINPSKGLLPAQVTSESVRIFAQTRGDITVSAAATHPSELKSSKVEKDEAVGKPLEQTEDDGNHPLSLYITRSGRVLKNRHSQVDSDKKATPSKRQRSLSSTKDAESPVVKQMVSIENHESISKSNAGNLDCLLHAANLIKSENEVCLNGDTIKNIEQSLPHVDSTTSIAATAMLELLSSQATKDLPNEIQENCHLPNETVDFVASTKCTVGDTETGSFQSDQDMVYNKNFIQRDSDMIVELCDITNEKIDKISSSTKSTIEKEVDNQCEGEE